MKNTKNMKNTKKNFLSKLVICLAMLLAASCIFMAVGCNQEKTDGEKPPVGDRNDQTNGGTEDDGKENGDQNTGNVPDDEILAHPDCGHKLNKYGFCGTCQVEMSRVTVAIGKDITLEYHIVVHDPDLLKGKNLQVVINDGDHVEVINDLSPENNGYVFKYHGIAPHQMAHEVDAALVMVTDGDLIVIDDILNYSVKQNIKELISAHKDDAEIVQILSDILRYGAAAQLYQNYEVEDLATDGVEGLAPARTDVPEKTDKTLEFVEGVVSDTFFNGATVWFGSTTRLKITVKTDDISQVTLKVNGVDVSGDKLEAGEEAGVYYYYTEDIGMAHFGDIYTFTVYDNGVEVETLTYSVNSYVYSMMNSENTKMAELALALYRAGASAAEWVATHAE